MLLVIGWVMTGSMLCCASESSLLQCCLPLSAVLDFSAPRFSARLYIARFSASLLFSASCLTDQCILFD